MTKKKRVHVVALPYPSQGHINPMMSLCKELARRGCMVTFVNTQINHDRLMKSHHESNSNLNLVAITGGPPPELHGDGKALGRIVESIVALSRPFEELLESLLMRYIEEDTPHFILSDVFMSWSRMIGEKHGLSYAAFATCSIAANSCFMYMNQILQQAFLPYVDHKGSNDDVVYIGDDNKLVTSAPGVPPMPPSDMPFTSINSEVKDAFYQYVGTSYSRLHGVPWILANSFMELERTMVEGLKEAGTLMHPIGPLIPSKYLVEQNHALKDEDDPSMWPEDKRCLEWLDGKEEGSVLYISFGSIAIMSSKQFTELALGIEASEQAFLWVARDNFIDGHKTPPFPPGFLRRVHGHGLFVKWCPQIKVLSHKSIGGFLTHCGWNSTLESISMGVPLLCWPDIGERCMNRRFCVSIWNVGLEFQHGTYGWVTKEEVERVVRMLMKEEHGHNVRQKAIQLSLAAKKARKENGSSSKTLDSFIAHMNEMA